LAADKRKILELARKLAQKNAKDKALAEYQKLLKLDPKDAKLRLEVGDAHRRWGQVEEAVETYHRVAEQYMAEGFDARAVAVFKQILNLAPDRYEAYAPLAELYERMGLTAEALAALQTAADGYHRQGKKSEALDLLRKMANADPSNTRSRIKVADLLRQEGKQEDAIAEYLLAAEELERQADVEAVAGVYRRILELDERNVRALSTLAKSLAGRGKVAEAIALAERALQLDDGNTERYEQLATLFESAKKLPEQERVLRRLAELYRSRGDESRARDILQRFAEVGDLADPGNEIAPPETDELRGGDLLDGDGDPGDLFGDEFPDTADAPGPSIDFGSELEIGPGASLAGVPREPLAGEASLAAPAPTELLLEDVRGAKPPVVSDWEQLLAEASVYLRYGKRDKAIAHLQRVIAANPNHRGALEKLGEAHAENGDHAKAVEIWLRAAQRAHEERDVDALRVLRGRIAVLDESAAAHIPTEVRGAAKPAREAPGAKPPAAKAPATKRPAPAPEPEELALDEDEFLDDLSLETDDRRPPPVALEDDESGLVLDDEPELGNTPEFGDAPDLEDEPELEAPVVEQAKKPATAPASKPVAARPREVALDAAAKQQLLDQLEEADFYMQQGLHDEAEAIYRQVLEAAPDHARALARLEEIAAARGEVAAPRRPAATPVDDPGELSAPEIDLEGDGDLTEPEATPDEPDEVEIHVDFSEDEIGSEPEPLVAGAELDDLASLDLDDAGEAPGGPEGEAGADGTDTEEFVRPAVEPPAPTPPGVAAPAASEGEGDFDLAAALADAFDDDTASGSRSALPIGDDGFAAVFQAFKKGVSEQLSEGDHQAHYDLAIAYKEMGLYDDAIYELRTAMADPNRTAECLHLIGLCAIDSDQAPLAIEHLEQLLSLPKLAGDAALAGRFDLGRALEAVGDVEGARREWQSVAAQNPGFQNVRARLDGLGAPKPDDASPGYESFDDVIGESGEVEPEEVVVGGETFDDLVAEANTGGIEPEPAADPVVEPEPVPEPVLEADPIAEKPAPPPPRRKKKISFL
jgi:tetratricopeptide (TPR) repeat protein